MQELTILNTQAAACLREVLKIWAFFAFVFSCLSPFRALKYSSSASVLGERA